jgi:hypothetical protein
MRMGDCRKCRLAPCSDQDHRPADDHVLERAVKLESILYAVHIALFSESSRPSLFQPSVDCSNCSGSLVGSVDPDSSGATPSDGVSLKKTGSPKAARNFLILLMARDGIEPPTHGFSVRCSTN